MVTCIYREVFSLIGVIHSVKMANAKIYKLLKFCYKRKRKLFRKAKLLHFNKFDTKTMKFDISYPYYSDKSCTSSRM